MEHNGAAVRPAWLAGVPFTVRLRELTAAGLSPSDALLHLLEWAVRRRPLEEIEFLMGALEPYARQLPSEVAGDLRWLQGYAALRSGRYASALAAVSALYNFDRQFDRPLGPHERGPQVLVSVMVAQAFRELGALTSAQHEATTALGWLGDLGATDFRSCRTTAGQLWEGAHILGFELEVGLAEDAIADGELSQARGHAVAARRWLSRHALDEPGGREVVWWHRITLWLMWSKLALARGWTGAAVHHAERAVRLAIRFQALPYLARSQYQHGLALLGMPFTPTDYLADPLRAGSQEQRQPALQAVATAAATAEVADMPQLAASAHLTAALLAIPHDPRLARLHSARATDLALRVDAALTPELALWWELCRMPDFHLAHTAANADLDHPLWTFEPSHRPAPHRDEHQEAGPVSAPEDLPQPPDLPEQLRTALRNAGYALADETDTGAVLISQAPDQPGLILQWRPSSALDRIQAQLSAELMMKQLPPVLEVLGFLVRPYGPDPGQLVVDGTYAPLLAADECDGGDRAVRWYHREIQSRHAQLGWLADTQIYDAATEHEGLAGHPLRDLAVRSLVALDDAGLPLSIDQPSDPFGTGIRIAVYPHPSHGSYLMLSWEYRRAHHGDYQVELFRAAASTLVERVLNAAGIRTSGTISDGVVQVLAQNQPSDSDLQLPAHPAASAD